MSRKTIAPDVLDSLLRAYGVPGETLDRAIAQAKALLAVAAAVRPVARAMNPCATISGADLERLRLADARLSRLSRGVEGSAGKERRRT